METVKYEDGSGWTAWARWDDRADAYVVRVQSPDGEVTRETVDAPAFMREPVDTYGSLVAAAKAGISFALAEAEAGRSAR